MKRQRRVRRRCVQGRQGGYVLLMVITTLAVIAFVALRFAERIDLLRGNALGFSDYAAARASASGAQAAALYWMATRPYMPAGHGDARGALREDGRPYRMGDGALVSVQDQRGLLSVNALNRPALLNLLIQDGVEVVRAQALMDVLEDYLDTDNLKRLNGAEKSEYAALGLPAPRNDWLLSLNELKNMPLWRDDPERLARLVRLLSVTISNQFNPNTAPLEVLRAIFPAAAAAQLDLLRTLRKGDLLSSGSIATRATGLPMDREDYWFLPGFETRITVWAQGMPRALEYTIKLTPAGSNGPWVFTEKHDTRRPSPSNEPSATLPFPLALAASGPALSASAAAR